MRRDYFKSRNVPVQMDYDDAYLLPQRDPDGVLRDPYKERERKLEDLAQELDYVNSLKPGRLLDVGCGLGFFISGVSEGWERHGQEVSKPCADHAAQYCSAFQGTLEAAAYPESYFDVVVSMSVVEHIPDPVPTIREMWRVLKPGGKLVLRTPNFDSGAARRFGANYRLLQTPGHVTLFSDMSLARLLHDVGFDVDHVEYPFFETRHFTRENLVRLFDASKVSPPFYGNHMCFYATKPEGATATQWSRGVLADLDTWMERYGRELEAGVALSIAHGGGGPLSLSVSADLVGRGAELAARLGARLTPSAAMIELNLDRIVFGVNRLALPLPVSAGSLAVDFAVAAIQAVLEKAKAAGMAQA
jgi:2-polyprenyl-3-methyl-5-hydroxy-6-metoxy-1,4-benzoquinol methylase